MENVSTSWHSYPRAFNVGHGAVKEILSKPVIVEEKIDGSQFSFGIFNGEIRCRSKGATLNLDAPEKMFIPAIASVMCKAANLRDGWTYRGEFCAKPKHNTLCYDRVPTGYIIGFDINTNHEEYLSYEEKEAEFARIGLETVPLLFEGILEDYIVCRALLDKISILGGAKIEGVVIKSSCLFGADGKRLQAKFVSEEFKEVHSSDWKERFPSNGDYIQRLIEDYRTPARWSKALQHLKEEGKVVGDPRDIGALISEVARDVEAECAAEIKDKLFSHVWPKMKRAINSGLPQWYKELLLKESFREGSNVDSLS